MPKSLPVAMYHYISSWPNPIAVDPDVFESHLEAMTRAGYRGVGLDEAEEFLLEGRPIEGKAALLTFDDGFLDNFVNAWPLLEKHGHKGVVFTVSNKIVAENLPRPTLKDVWSGFVGMDELPQVNAPVRRTGEGLRVRRDLFFSWKEARLMEDSGVMRMAAHTHTHRSVFTSADYSKLFTPGVRRRTFDRLDHEVLYGLPQFGRGPAMGHEAFLPSTELYDMVHAEVPQDYDGAKAFFADPDNAQRIEKAVAALSRDRLGRMETPEEFRERLRADLSACKQLMEQELGREVRSLAWPWGTFSAEALDEAKKLGFAAFFTTAVGPNLPGRSADAAHRFKARNKNAKWFMSRLSMYSKPFMARLYGLIHH
ncbi:polysaccharide deacetylase family protein [Desulfocurvus sp. DL9XJH121]